jgi:hypothetical protein
LGMKSFEVLGKPYASIDAELRDWDVCSALIEPSPSRQIAYKARSVIQWLEDRLAVLGEICG